jgi:hypothetical protein
LKLNSQNWLISYILVLEDTGHSNAEPGMSRTELDHSEICNYAITEHSIT